MPPEVVTKPKSHSAPTTWHLNTQNLLRAFLATQKGVTLLEDGLGVVRHNFTPPYHRGSYNLAQIPLIMTMASEDEPPGQ